MLEEKLNCLVHELISVGDNDDNVDVDLHLRLNSKALKDHL